MMTSNSNREREHAERMLKRAQRQQARAGKLVEKWQTRMANLDRAGVAAMQPRLWPDEAETGISPTSLGSVEVVLGNSGDDLVAFVTPAQRGWAYREE